MKKADIKVNQHMAGWLWQDENGYHFKYDPAWLASEEAEPVSLTLPLKTEPFDSNILRFRKDFRRVISKDDDQN